MKLHTFLLCAASAALFTTSCNDWLDVEPSTEVDRNALFQNEAGFADARKTIENYIKKNYMRSVQAPLGVRPRLVTWMELC